VIRRTEGPVAYILVLVSVIGMITWNKHYRKCFRESRHSEDSLNSALVLSVTFGIGLSFGCTCMAEQDAETNLNLSKVMIT
jgi:hypothetical protein